LEEKKSKTPSAAKRHKQSSQPEELGERKKKPGWRLAPARRKGRTSLAFLGADKIVTESFPARKEKDDRIGKIIPNREKLFDGRKK